MTKQRIKILRRAILNLTQYLELGSQQHILNNLMYPLTFVFGKPPNSICFQYIAPLELVKKHLNSSPQEIMSKIPWEAVDKQNSDDAKRIQNDFLELLILCPSSEEIIEYRKFLNEEKASFNMLNKLKTLEDESFEEKKIQANLNKLASPDFHKLIEGWKKIKKIKKSLSKVIEKVSQLPFSPKHEETFDTAYEKLLRVTKLENYQYYSLLIDGWKSHLRKTIFEGSCWPITKQAYFFEVWERVLFKKIPPSMIPMKMRWQQAQSIDRLTAGKVIKYFNDSFISRGKPIHGQIACILWTLIAISRQLQENGAHIKLIDVVTLTKADVNTKNRSLIVNRREINISKGLAAIYSILSDVKYGKREIHLFPGMTVDRLEDALKKASRELFPENSLLITPQAFLTFPHPFEGVRIAPKLLQGMCDKEAYKLKPDDRIGLILRPFKLPIHSSKNECS